MPLTKVCELCGREFKVPPSDAKQRFCSKECGDRSRRVVTEYTCPTCGKVFTKRGKRNERVKYCSPECRNIGLQNRIVRKCFTCGKDVVRPKSQNASEHVFCSMACAVAFRTETFRGENHPRYNSVKKICAICGKEFKVPYSVDISKNARTCSWACRVEYERKHPRKNKENPIRQYLIAQKNIAMERDNYTCQKCGSKENLEVHHIKKRRTFGGDFSAADNANNLITYCNTCHLSEEPRKLISESEYRANLSDCERLKDSVERSE